MNDWKWLLLNKEDPQNKNKLILSLLLDGEHQKLMGAEVYDLSEAYPLGTVFMGRVGKTLSQIEGCFITLPEQETAFLPLHSHKEYLTPVNRVPDGRILEGDLLLLQVRKEAQKNKPMEVSPCLELAGEYVVISFGTGKVRYSAKLSQEEKSHCKKMVENNSVELQDFLDMTFRTQAGKAAPEDVICEAKEKIDLLRDLKERQSRFAKGSQVLYKEGGLWSLLRKDLNAYRSYYDISDPIQILTKDETLFRELTEEVTSAGKGSDLQVTFYDETKEKVDLTSLYSITTLCTDLMHKKVYLRSGGSVVIEQTEALVSVDVNTGKNQKRQDPEAYYLSCNLEAADIILRELKIRNLSGMILIDFINMKDPQNMRKLLSYLKDACKNVYRDVSFVDVTKLGLVELTKAKRGKPLSEQMMLWNSIK